MKRVYGGVLGVCGYAFLNIAKYISKNLIFFFEKSVVFMRIDTFKSYFLV